MAAGLTVARDRLPAAMARLSELLARQGAGAEGPRELHLDGLLMPGAAGKDLIERLEAAGPFGQSAPAPRFAFPAVLVQGLRRIGDGHLKLTLGDGAGVRLEAMAFNAFRSEIGGFFEAHVRHRVHVAGRLDLNHWGGRVTPQLTLDDTAPAT
jgi:single-stranded-DNA-specific exonuclease